jgi:hypothetical protein
MRKGLAILVLMAIGLPLRGQQESGHPQNNQPSGKPQQAQRPTITEWDAQGNPIGKKPEARPDQTQAQRDTDASIYSHLVNVPPPSSGTARCVIHQTTDLSNGVMDCEYTPPAPPSYFDSLFASSNLPNVLLVIVGSIGICVALRTLSKIQGQINAAVRDTQIRVNAQRPYLVISVEPQLLNQFVFTAKNEGETPARINSRWCKLLMEDPDGTLQIPSDEEMANSVMTTPPQLLPPKGTCTVYVCDEHRLKLMRGDAFRAVYFHGRIIYSNTLGVDPVRPYETKWLYCQLPLKGELSLPRPDARRPEHNTWT